jgi:hypothetical protein
MEGHLQTTTFRRVSRFTIRAATVSEDEFAAQLLSFAAGPFWEGELYSTGCPGLHVRILFAGLALWSWGDVNLKELGDDK